jgi:hypothetical protein
MMRTQLLCKVLFISTMAYRHNGIAHLRSVLQSQVTKTSKALDSYNTALTNTCVSHGAEDGDSSAKEGGDFSGIGIRGDSNGCFGAEEDVLCVAAVHTHTVDFFVVADLEHALLAGTA